MFLHLTVCKRKTVFNPMANCVETKDCTYVKLSCWKLSETI